MSATRIFLGISALVWLSYGLYCLTQPGYLAGAAGVAASTPTGTTELRAMYGGLEAAIGALALLGLLRSELERPVLLALLFLCAGLALGRMVGLLQDGSGSAYTFGALAFELVLAGVAGGLLAGSAGSPGRIAAPR